MSMPQQSAPCETRSLGVATDRGLASTAIAQTFRSLATNTASNLGLRAATLIGTFVSIPILVHQLGPSFYGIMTLAMALMGYFSLLDLGFPAGTVKYVAEYHAQGDLAQLTRTINACLTLFTVVGFVASAALCILALSGGMSLFRIPLGDHAVAQRVLLLAGGLSLFNWPKLALENVFKGLQEYHLLNLRQAVCQFGAVGAALLAAGEGARPEVVFVLLNGERILGLVWLCIALRRRLPFISFAPENPFSYANRGLLTLSGWMLLTSVAVMLEYAMDNLVLANALPVAAITTYTVLMMPFRLISQVSSIGASAVLPAVSVLQASHGRSAVDEFTILAVRYHNLLFVPVAITLAYLCRPVIRLWMGPAYLAQVEVAELGAVFQLIWQSNAVLGQVWCGTGRVKMFSLLAIVTGVCNVSLSFWWVRVFGVAGVMLATFAVGLVSCGLQYVIVFPHLGIDRWAFVKAGVLKAQIPLLLCGVALYPLRHAFASLSSWPAVAFSAALILGLLYATGLTCTVDRDIREQLFRRAALTLKQASQRL